MKSICIILLCLIIGSNNGFSQGFTPPSEGKAKVYFIRVSGYAFMVSFDLFNKEKYIGKIKSTSYVPYECDPGENLFWASGENKVFLTANLKAGETYIIVVDVRMGMMSAGVGFTPINSEHKLFKRAKKLVLQIKPQITTQETVDYKTKKLEDRGFIKDKLNLYETQIKNTPKCKNLTIEMFVPKELLINKD